MPYQRPQFQTLFSRLAEPRRFIQVVAGPRQVGKTTLVQQVCEAIGPLLVGGDGIAVDEFLQMPLESWLNAG